MPIIDDAGVVTEGLIDSLTKNLKSGLSRSDFVRLSQSLQSKRESVVLEAVSSILNKDFDNVATVNSLAVFYLKRNRLGMAGLILNRLADKDDSNSVIMNNLAVISLKYGKPRLAVSYLKKALSMNRSYGIARVNLANIFIRNYDYQSAYSLYKGSYNNVITNKLGKTQKAVFLLNNYTVAITGSKKWKEGEAIFKSMTSGRAPLPESLFNYSCFLAEKSKEGKMELVRNDLLKAKSLVEELQTYNLKRALRNKLKQLLSSINFQIRELNRNNSKKQTARAKRRK